MSEKAQISGMMYVQLDAYLRRLRAIEGRKPKNKRRNVPTMTQLAEVAGVSRNSLSRISRGYTKSLNLEIAGAILSEMWRRGFEMEPNDLLNFEPPPSLAPQKSRPNDPWAPPPPPLTRRQHQKYPGEEFVKAYAESDSTAEDAKEL